MRVSISLLNWALDLTIEPATDEAPDDTPCSLDGGTTSSTTTGFTPQWAQPEDAPLPQRTPAWDEPE